MSIRLTAAFLLTFSLLIAGGAARADAFFSVIEDLPVMEGLTENENAAVTFETAAGRIVEAAARGDVPPSKVSAFYDAVLPQLGWTPEQGDGFVREGERLKVSVAPDGDTGTVLTLSLSPVAK